MVSVNDRQYPYRSGMSLLDLLSADCVDIHDSVLAMDHRGRIIYMNPQCQNLLALENEGNYYNLLKDMADTASIIPVLFGYYTVYAERGLFDNLTPSRDNVFYYSLGKTMEGTQRETVYN